MTGIKSMAFLIGLMVTSAWAAPHLANHYGFKSSIDSHGIIGPSGHITGTGLAGPSGHISFKTAPIFDSSNESHQHHSPSQGSSNTGYLPPAIPEDSSEEEEAVDHAAALAAHMTAENELKANGYPADVTRQDCENYPYCGPTPPQAQPSMNQNQNSEMAYVPVYMKESAKPATSISPEKAAASHATVLEANKAAENKLKANGYPADVTEQDCYNYPYCGPTPAETQHSVNMNSQMKNVPVYMSQPTNSAESIAEREAAAAHAAALAAHMATENEHKADDYPADVTEQDCENYPYCGPTPAETQHSVNMNSQMTYVPVYMSQPANSVESISPEEAASAHADALAAHMAAENELKASLNDKQYPANVNEEDCENYPYCGPTPPAAKSKPTVNQNGSGQMKYSYTHDSQPVQPANSISSEEAAAAHADALAAHMKAENELQASLNAEEYPADVTRQDCENYPYCGPTPPEKNPAGGQNVQMMHSYTSQNTQPPQSISAEEEAADHAAALAAHMAAENELKADKYPADVSKQDCANYPYCGPTPQGQEKHKASQGSGHSHEGYANSDSTESIEGSSGKIDNYGIVGPSGVIYPSKLVGPSGSIVFWQ